jgi:hypothetical protein
MNVQVLKAMHRLEGKKVYWLEGNNVLNRRKYNLARRKGNVLAR